jgi:probable HAF family extracellular repeat protein
MLTFTIVTLLAMLVLPCTLAAQSHPSRYRIIELPTLGGPGNYPSVNRPGYQIMSNSGIVAIGADTSTADPFAPNCFNPDCFLSHAALWKNAVLTDLGALTGNGNSSASGAVNARGWVAGQSENGEIDPLSGLPETRATLWTPAGIVDLGTFGGNWSLATTLNDVGQVVGFASNTIPDPFAAAFFPLSATQMRAFLWQNGALQDLGTLGGPDALALYLNQRGLVAGVSYTDATPNGTTLIPTVHPFLWHNGKMTDLGSLGGTFTGSFGPDGSEGSLVVNDRGQVIGISTLAGDQIYHPFLWENGAMKDLGTLGGDNGTALWLTDKGEVVGQADLPGSEHHHAFLWRHGAMTDLGTLGINSTAVMMNSAGQIVGRSRTPDGLLHAFLWEKGGPIVDLNTLIPSGSNLILEEAENINNWGEILVWAQPPGCLDDHLCGRLVLLVPCNAQDASACEIDTGSMAADSQVFVRVNEGATTALQAQFRSSRLGAWVGRWQQNPSRINARPRD